MTVKNSMYFMLGASLTLVTGFVRADVVQTFENYEADTLAGSVVDDNATWSGDGTVTALSEVGSSASKNGGSPTEGKNSTKYLAVAGEVACVCNGPTATKTAQVDFLVKITEASDTLDALDGDVQIAVAAGSTAEEGQLPICVYCKNRNGEVAWVETGVKVAIGAWARVTLTFDYVNSRCRVAVDGLPVISAQGYLSPSDGTATNGSWYRLATDKTVDTAVSEVKIIGSTAVDDVNIAQKSSDAKDVEIGGLPATAKTTIAGIEVNNADLVKWGVDATTAQAVKLDASGLTVADKIVCGLDPTDGSKFEMTKIVSGSGNTVKVRFPGKAPGSRYTVSVYDNEAGEGEVLAIATGDTAIKDVEGGKEAAVDLSKIDSSKKVLFFKVNAAVKAAVEAN